MPAMVYSVSTKESHPQKSPQFLMADFNWHSSSLRIEENSELATWEMAAQEENTTPGRISPINLLKCLNVAISHCSI